MIVPCRGGHGPPGRAARRHVPQQVPQGGGRSRCRPDPGGPHRCYVRGRTAAPGSPAAASATLAGRYRAPRLTGRRGRSCATGTAWAAATRVRRTVCGRATAAGARCPCRWRRRAWASRMRRCRFNGFCGRLRRWRSPVARCAPRRSHSRTLAPMANRTAGGPFPRLIRPPFSQTPRPRRAAQRRTPEAQTCGRTGVAPWPEPGSRPDGAQALRRPMRGVFLC